MDPTIVDLLRPTRVELELEEERRMTTIEERLAGGASLPWIPDPDRAAKYERDSCSLNPLVGVAVDHFRRENYRQDGEIDVVVLNVDGVGDVAVHCQATVLASQMHAARPKPGERVGVQWFGEKVGASGVSYTDYRVVVDRERGSDFSWSDGPARDDEFQTQPPPENAPDNPRQNVPTPAVQNIPAPAAPTPEVDDSIPF
jgi:hypothetical protein